MKSIFPKAEETIILDILANNDNNIQKASDALKQMGFEKKDVVKILQQQAEIKAEEKKKQEEEEIAKASSPPPKLLTTVEKVESKNLYECTAKLFQSGKDVLQIYLLCSSYYFSIFLFF